jgi:hypothetical protein
MPCLPKRAQQVLGGPIKFFLTCMAHDNLYNFYKLNFALMQYHKYHISDIENMMPFEREIYTTMLRQYLEEEKQRLERKQ